MLRLLLIGALCSPVPALADDGGEPLMVGGKPLSVVAVARAGLVPGDVFWSAAPSDPLREPFDVLFFQGILVGSDIVVEASVGHGGAWGPWIQASVHAAPNGRFWASAPVSGRAGDRVRLRARSLSGAFSSVEIFGVRAERRVSDPGGSGRPTPGPARPDSLPAPAPGAPPNPEVLARAQWGADSARKPYEPMVPNRITVHHTEAFQPFSREDAIHEMRMIQNFHQDGRGWIDIGYHFVIDGSGRIWEGRPLEVVGAHVKDKNTGNVGISLMGSFHPPRNNQPATAQTASLVALMRWLTAAYQIPVDRIMGHRDQRDTSCPGDILYARLPELRRQTGAPASEPLPALASPRSLPSLFERFRPPR